MADALSCRYLISLSPHTPPHLLLPNEKFKIKKKAWMVCSLLSFSLRKTSSGLLLLTVHYTGPVCQVGGRGALC